MRVAIRNIAAALLLSPVAATAQANPTTAAPPEPGQTDLSAAITTVHADIATSVAELNTLRASVTGKRTPLATRLETLQKEVQSLRRDADRMRTLRELGRNEQDQLEHETEALREECRFMQSLLAEYRRSLETRMGPAEAAMLAPSLAEVDEALSAESPAAGLSEAATRLLALATRWNGERVGGTTFPGHALDDDGVERAGTFATFGPLAYFAGDGPTAGIVVSRLGSSHPSIFSALDENMIAAVRRLSEGADVVVPCDLTSGSALLVEQAREPLVEHLKKGGVVMVPLLAIGVAAALLAIWKLLELARLPTRPAVLASRILEEARKGDVDDANATARQLPQPMASLMLEGIEHREATKEHLEEILHEHVLACIPRLERHLGTLAVFGGVAPLLGLLGTVTGMIHTFQLVTIFGSGNAKLLSAGISEALITTKCGLAIAIPVLLVHAFLARRVRDVVSAMERMATDFVHGLKLKRANGGRPQT
jgi:biopolymer transport protein ExbB